MTSSVANPNGLREATADGNTLSLLELPFNLSRDNNKLTTNTHWLFCSFLILCSLKKKETFFLSNSLVLPSGAVSGTV